MLPVGLSYMVFIMLRCVPSIPTSSFYHKWVLDFIKCFTNTFSKGFSPPTNWPLFHPSTRSAFAIFTRVYLWDTIYRVIRSKDSGAGLLGFRSQLYPLLSMWPWTVLTFPSLVFPIDKMGITWLLTGCSEDWMSIYTCISLSKECLAYSKNYVNVSCYYYYYYLWKMPSS